MIRARPVAGDADLGRRFLDLLGRRRVGPAASPTSDEREIRRMKARIERERIPAGEDPEFHLKLGRGSLSDVEFTAQLLQLRTGVRSPATMAALDRLVAGRSARRRTTPRCWPTPTGSASGPGTAGSSSGRRAGGDALPQRPDDQLARWPASLGTTPGELREDYRRVTRRARGSSSGCSTAPRDAR